MNIPGFVLYPAGVALITVTSALYIWFRRPEIAVRFLFKLAFYTSGLRARFVKGHTYIYCYGERGCPRPDKPSMLFVHGFSSNKEQWVSVVQKLPKDLHIIAVDMPGHGDTTTPGPDDEVGIKELMLSLHDFVEAVGLDTQPFHLIGTSMGGAICGCYAAEFPSHVKRLTVICPALRTPVKTAFMREIDEGQCRLIPETAEELKEMFKSLTYYPIKIRHQFFVGSMNLRKPRNQFFRRLFHALNTDKEGEEEALKKLTQITMPVQVIWGKHDQIIHVSGAEVLKEKVVNIASIEIYEKCGHIPTMDRPGKLTKSLLEFRGEYQKKQS